MKKHIALVLIALGGMVLSSCGETNTNSSIATPDSSTSIPVSSAPSLSSTATEVSVSITGPTSVRYGNTITLSVTVTGSQNQTVTWTKSSNLVSIEDGVVSVNSDVEEDTDVTITVTPIADMSKSATHTITVLAPEPAPVLTQAMLDATMDDTIEFTGNNNVDLYYITNGNFAQSYTFEVTTMMEKDRWVAEYTSTTNNATSRIYYGNDGGKAAHIDISLMNEVSYNYLIDNNGEIITWTDAGLYNPLVGLQATDFTFNRETFLYEYSGTDATLLERAAAACTPYDFSAKTFGLVIEEDEIVGVKLVSNDDYTIATGYRAIQTLTSTFNVGAVVEVPPMPTYEHRAEHDDLATAINNMRTLESYTTDVVMLNSVLGSSAITIEGYREYVTEDTLYFQDLLFNTSGNVVGIDTTSGYGYKKIDDNTYNSFNRTRGDNPSYYASRAFSGELTKSRPSFAFAAEIFDPGFSYDSDTHDKTYFSYLEMARVATTWYNSLGNDMPLYGMFAGFGRIDASSGFTPYVVVSEDNYITDAVFFADLGTIQALFQISFSDFNTTTLPVDTNIEFTPREVPTSWGDLMMEYLPSTPTVNPNPIPGSDDHIWHLDDVMDDMFGPDAKTVIPFIQNAIGDAFGFAMETTTNVTGTSQYLPTLLIYYDVPLDDDLTITSSINAIQAYLLEQGFTYNGRDGYEKDGYVVSVVDTDLDLNVYIHKLPTAA